MDKTLNKRLIRDLKHNIGRYLAMMLMIILGVYLVVSIVGSSEMIITGTEDAKSTNHVEDGQFTTFLQLTDNELEDLSSNGTVIEEMFYYDVDHTGSAKLRVFKTRSDIDLITLDEGRLATSTGEAVIDKNYASSNCIKTGDTITVEGVQLSITGIGSVPDYDCILPTFASPAADSDTFGLIFVSAEQYDELLVISDKPEEYNYAFILGDETAEDFKERIKNFEFDYEAVEDPFFRESIGEVLDRRDELKDAVSDLEDGTSELNDGLNELDGNSQDLNEAARGVFDSYLNSASASLKGSGVRVELTRDNYSSVLDGLSEQTGMATFSELRAQLDDLKEFEDGVAEYTNGVNEALDGSSELADGMNEFSDKMDDLIEEIFELDLNNLTSFVKAEDNVRIAAASGDVVMDKNVGLVAGVIVLMLFAYVLSVFIVHQIDEEQSVIGALYSLGVKKNDLLCHYVALPTLLALLSGIIGTAIAYSPIGISMMAQSTYDYFCIPAFPMTYPPYLIVYGIVMPPLICMIVNILTINGKLSRTALSLLRNEQGGTSRKQYHLKIRSFKLLFAVRQLLRESRSAVIVFLGMLFTLMVVILGINTYTLCNNVKEGNVKDTKYEYSYLLKYPANEAPSEGESAYIENLTIECFDYDLDVSVIGLDENSKYFDADPSEGKNKVVVNRSLVERYGFASGDLITLEDKTQGLYYTFEITDISEYSVGFAVFMDIGSMRDLFGKGDDYYNVIYSDKELGIDSGRLYSVTTKSSIESSSSVFVNTMMSMVVTLISAGIIIFCVVMYLMMAVMIDRSKMGISLIKIFGYRSDEVRSLYLNGNTFIVAAGALIAIPLAKLVIDNLYPSFICNVACSMDLSYSWMLYLAIYLGIMLIYLCINAMLLFKINRITPAEVLKERE